MPYLAPLAAMPTNSSAPRLAEMNARPVTHAGIDRPEVRKSDELFRYRLKTNPMAMTKTT
jgi:hypothetical protein